MLHTLLCVYSTTMYDLTLFYRSTQELFQHFRFQKRALPAQQNTRFPFLLVTFHRFLYNMQGTVTPTVLCFSACSDIMTAPIQSLSNRCPFKIQAGETLLVGSGRNTWAGARSWGQRGMEGVTGKHALTARWPCHNLTVDVRAISSDDTHRDPGLVQIKPPHMMPSKIIPRTLHGVTQPAWCHKNNTWFGSGTTLCYLILVWSWSSESRCLGANHVRDISATDRLFKR